ncbi:MAG: RNA polymerase subunit sigma-70 [Clostridiaceae bacterium]|nr:RNA polymerase subunit sigma-70 [Eubacteriales bacterium]
MTVEQKEKIQQMRRDGAGYGQMAAALGVSKETVKSFCRRNPGSDSAQAAPVDNAVAATAAEADRAVEGIVCRQCGKRLIQRPKLKPKRFCSDECRLAWWRSNENQLNKKALYTIRCAGCGHDFESYGNKARIFCGHACYIKSRFGDAEHDQRAV